MRGILWFIILGFGAGLWTYNVFIPGTGKPVSAKVIFGIFRVGFLSVVVAAAIGLALDLSKIEQTLALSGAIVGAVGGGAIWAGVHWFMQARRAKVERARAALAAAEKAPQQTKQTRIFISYRRLEDGAHAGRIADRLRNEFDFHDIFIDFGTAALGRDFVELINQELANCDALLVVISPSWLDARTKDGGPRRLDNPGDFVRIEIATALKRNIPVFPILVDGAEIPSADQLPEELKGLSRAAMRSTSATTRSEATWTG
jgi:hypothetical protein